MSIQIDNVIETALQTISGTRNSILEAEAALRQAIIELGTAGFIELGQRASESFQGILVESGLPQRIIQEIAGLFIAPYGPLATSTRTDTRVIPLAAAAEIELWNQILTWVQVARILTRFGAIFTLDDVEEINVILRTRRQFFQLGTSDALLNNLLSNQNPRRKVICNGKTTFIRDNPD